jgi:hypothetical protein
MQKFRSTVMGWILKTSSILLNVLMLKVNIGDFDWSRVLQHLSYIAWVFKLLGYVHEICNS